MTMTSLQFKENKKYKVMYTDVENRRRNPYIFDMVLHDETSDSWTVEFILIRNKKSSSWHRYDKEVFYNLFEDGIWTLIEDEHFEEGLFEI